MDPQRCQWTLVDGSDLPMRITNNVGCPVADGSADLSEYSHRVTIQYPHSCIPVSPHPDCPAQLGGPADSSGATVGCKSACSANVGGNPQDSPNGCSGSHNTPATCLPSGVAFYSYFKDRCPNGYVYAYHVRYMVHFFENNLLTVAHIPGILRNRAVQLRIVESCQLCSDVLPVEPLVWRITLERYN